MESDARKPVLIFRAELLPISETFILAQTRAMKRYVPRFVGLRRVKRSLPVPDGAVVATRDNSFIERFFPGAHKRSGIDPRFHRRARKLGGVLIHAHFALDAALALPLINKLKLPLIVTLHGFDVTISDADRSQSRSGRLYLRHKEELWERTDLFLCVSDFMLAKAREVGFPEHKLRRHYIGLDLSEFAPETGSDGTGTDAPVVAEDAAQSVLFVGRLVEKKGGEHLIRAMAIVQQRVPGAVLKVVGDGPLRDSLPALAASLGVKAEFLGPRSSAEIRQMLRQTAVFCVPSISAKDGDSEGFGIVFLEAEAMGVPVVSYRHGGIPEAVADGQTGLLAPEGDYEKLAEYLLLFLENKQMRDEFGARGIQFVRANYDVEDQSRKLEDIYDEVLAAAPKRS